MPSSSRSTSAGRPWCARRRRTSPTSRRSSLPSRTPRSSRPSPRAARISCSVVSWQPEPSRTPRPMTPPWPRGSRRAPSATASAFPAGQRLVRAAAMLFASAATAVPPEAYPAIIAAVAAGGTDLVQRRELAARAFSHTAPYDTAVAQWFSEGTLSDGVDLPAHLTIKAERLATLRYGENSHQRAAIYTRAGGHGIAQATQLQGKEMSYNNYVDADAALR